MPLSWKEIRDRAHNFVAEWQDTTEERAEAQSFWSAFFEVFGLNRRRIASFEKAATTDEGTRGRIDLFWKGTLLVEHKSRGQSLEKAYRQGLGYFAGMKAEELPRYVIVSDFARIRLYDLDEGEDCEIALEDLPENLHRFGFIAGYQQRKYRDEDPVNIAAAELMGQLHDVLQDKGYSGRPLETLLVRLLFCFFADDSGVFEKDQFTLLVENHTREDGSDLGAQLNALFAVLDTPASERQTDLDDDWSRFPYVNGDLFRENLRPPFFDRASRDLLLRCCYFDWSRISPAIFGSMFQSAMNPAERRRLGAHYTSEKNVLKLISPLFLDGLRADFAKARGNARNLRKLHDRIAKLTCFDPACGCGNFLIVAYRELRRLEIDLLWELARLEGQADAYGRITGQLDVAELSRIDVDALYGIEIDDFAARIAEVALWLTDHQMNMALSERFGMYFTRLPLRKSPHIRNANALQTDWNAVLPAERCGFVLGNPPFIGSKLMSAQQRADLELIFQDFDGEKVMDYVTAWYWKAAKYIQHSNHIRVAFVSTNSVVQGEQVGYLWKNLINRFGIKIHFAHRTFKWTNEARGKAAVYCVIVGFANFDVPNKSIFEYETVKSEPIETKVQNINPYLIDAPDILITKRQKPICDVPGIAFGNMPLDGGHLLLTDDEKRELVASEPAVEPYIRPLISAREYLNNIPRWCIWLVDCPPADLRKMPLVLERVAAVKAFREASVAESTRKHASTPTLFRDRFNPEKFIVIPSTTSENRKYIPMGFFTKQYIPNNSTHIMPGGTLYHFGILMSEMHMAWVRVTCGRLENRFRYSKDLVYNNFPWPPAPTAAQRQKVESAAQEVLAVRSRHGSSTLADLYDPLAMPPDLVRAHQKLDAAVDACYGRTKFTTEGQRLAFLFDLYRQYAEPLERAAAKGKKRRPRRGARPSPGAAAE